MVRYDNMLWYDMIWYDMIWYNSTFKFSKRCKTLRFFQQISRETLHPPAFSKTQEAFLAIDTFSQVGEAFSRAACHPTGETFTPWKINMEPENDGLEDDFPLQLGDF